ncbi:tRNA methyltransferase [Mycena crocata]|nr:tRNA methyltransferase [Mycena crocata]
MLCLHLPPSLTATRLHRTLASRTLHKISSNPPFLGLNLLQRKRMAETATGETRGASPPADAPAAKKPRLEASMGDPVTSKVNVARPAAAKKPSKQSKSQKKRQQYNALPERCSADDVLWREIKDVLGEEYVNAALEEGTDRQSPFEYHQELEMQVVALCSSGSALVTSAEASRPWVVVVPFCFPGETVRVRVYRNARMHSVADLLEVVTPNPEFRDDSRVQCKYFGTCAGCQYQMLSYEKQLELKRDVVLKAYKNFSDLPATSVPPIEGTIGSPLQYNYRTKITPHFEAPTKAQHHDKKNANLAENEKPDWFKIGFNLVGTHKVMDIEDCPIATPIIRETLPTVRANAVKNLYTYKRGVSLILRDSLTPAPAAPTTATGTESLAVADAESELPPADMDPVDALSAQLEKHICVTDHRGSVREKVGSWLFEYPTGSFFQNNNAVLPVLTSYVQSRIFATTADAIEPPTHLVDAYCGAGLFAITLSPHFATVAGIELSADSIRAATRNALLNAIPASKLSFRAGDAADIFRAVPEFPRERTVLLVDPPRKGCDAPFIKQLLAFGARTVVYVSCNVHTQARDVGICSRRRRTWKAWRC